MTDLKLMDSERSTHKNATGPRGWENDQALMSRGKMKNSKYDDGDYHDLDAWEESDEETDDDDDDADKDSGDEQRRGKKSAQRSSNLNDINFEKTLEEYDEKEIGYLSEVRSFLRSEFPPWTFYFAIISC